MGVGVGVPVGGGVKLGVGVGKKQNGTEPEYITPLLLSAHSDPMANLLPLSFNKIAAVFLSLHGTSALKT